MSQISATPISSSLAAPAGVAVPTVNLRELAPWALLFGLMAVLALFFISSEQGALALLSGTDVHEWVHDGRHLLGFPCH